MNAQHSNNYTIGYDPVLTLAITRGIYARRAKAEAKARMDVIISSAKGEGVKLHNGKFNGTDGLFRQYPDGTVEQYVPETETEEGKVVGPTWRPVDYVI